MRVIVPLFFLLFNSTMFSQISEFETLTLPYTASDYVEIVGSVTLNLLNKKEDTNKSTVEGSPYLYKSWANDADVYIGNKVYKFNLFNYNVYSERFEAKISQDSVFIINARDINKVVIHNKVFRRYLDPEFQRNSYFEELARLNDVVLLRKYYAEIQEAGLNPLTKVPMGAPELLQKEKFYTLKVEDEALKAVKLKKAVILNLVDDDDVNILKTYAREHGLSFRNSDDVIQILVYYNSLGA